MCGIFHVSISTRTTQAYSDAIHYPPCSWWKWGMHKAIPHPTVESRLHRRVGVCCMVSYNIYTYIVHVYEAASEHTASFLSMYIMAYLYCIIIYSEITPLRAYCQCTV